jgi:hypothetical protein
VLTDKIRQLRNFRFWPVTMISLLLVARSAGAWLDPEDPNVVQVLATADNQFSSYNGPEGQEEWLLNSGAAPHSRVKGSQDVTGLQFELAPYRGRTVEAAELHLAKSDTSPVFALVAATINAPWKEGRGAGSSAREGESCWRWRSAPGTGDNAVPGEEWTFPGSDFSTASFGNYGTLVCYGYASDATFDTYESHGTTWAKMRLSPEIIHALLNDQYGLIVTDPRGYNGQYNPRIYTHDQSPELGPRLLIQFDHSNDTTPPDPVTHLTTEPRTVDGEALLSFYAPFDSAFGYRIRSGATDDINEADDVARWRIPRPAEPGVLQRVLLEDLDDTQYLFVQAYDQAGNLSTPVVALCTLPKSLLTPTLKHGGNKLPDSHIVSVPAVPGVLRYWACPGLSKVNPVTGNRIADGYKGTGDDDYKKGNIIWNAATSVVSLHACRNEVVGCQVIIERLGARLSNVKATISDLTGPASTVIPAGFHTEWFEIHYVTHEEQFYPDAAIPLVAPFPSSVSIPDENHNPLGVNQSFWLDIYVPEDAEPATYTGTITVHADELESPVELKLNIDVSAIRIPDTLSFMVDLNGYGSPWAFGNQSMSRLRYFQLAQKHRLCLNTLPYGWNGNVTSERAPLLIGTGASLRAAEWTAFDAAFGPFLDGSAFSPDHPSSPYRGPGMNTPVSTFYTPIHESWPTHVLDATYGFDSAGRGGPYWRNLLSNDEDAFWAEAPDVRRAFTQEYGAASRNIVRDWFKHAEDKGWHSTNFQVYLNNKYYYKDSPALWTLEECVTADDFRAVGFLHSLFRKGADDAQAQHVKWHWRLDISSRWGQHYGQLDGLLDWYAMSQGAVDWYWPNLRYRKILLNSSERWAWYGTGPAPQDAGRGHPQRFIQAWAQGLDGGVPYWDNFQTSWEDAASLSVVYSGASVPGMGTYDGAIASIRMKAMRQAQQLVELANLLSAAPHWSREQVSQALLSRYGDGTRDRGFSGLDEDRIYQMRADLVATLEAVAADDQR